MSEPRAPTQDRYEPGSFEIRIKGHLDGKWADWFEGLTIILEANGNTLITGPVIDQAALYGVLKKVRDLGMPLVSVTPVDSGHSSRLEIDQTDVSDGKP